MKNFSTIKTKFKRLKYHKVKQQKKKPQLFNHKILEHNSNHILYQKIIS